jgi:hypothetical protein
MRAQVILKADVARLVEGADEIAGAQHRLEYRDGIAGVGAQIAVGQVRRGKERCAATNIEQDVAARRGAGPNASAPRDEGNGTA